MARPKGTLTGSRHFKKPVETIDPIDTIKDVASNIGNATQSVASSVQTVTDNLKSVGKGMRSIKNSFDGGSSLVTDSVKTSLDKAESIGNQYNLQQLPLTDLIGGDPYKSSELIPEMKAVDANREKLKIQRQNNALDVRLEKIRQGRKLATVASEERKLLGDLVDYQTTGIETATKVVKNQIADTKYRVEQSKLEQTEEQLEQQQIATQGTLNLTEGIRHEWRLKAENQQAKNDRLKLEIEGTIRDTDRRREELEASLLDG